MTAADHQQPRPMNEEDREKNFAFDNRWPNGTYAFLAIKHKWGEVKSVNIFTLMAKYELALKSFTDDNFETWRSQLKNKKAPAQPGISGGYAGGCSWNCGTGT